MKAMKMFIAATVLGAATAGAQPEVKQDVAKRYFSTPARYMLADVKKACRNYRACLESRNDGVVESALAHVVRMKMCLQKEELCDLRAAIGSLSVAGRTPAIRYKAYLASLVLDNPEWFRDECRREYPGADELFTALANRLEKSLMGYADHKYVRPE